MTGFSKNDGCCGKKFACEFHGIQAGSRECLACRESVEIRLKDLSVSHAELMAEIFYGIAQYALNERLKGRKTSGETELQAVEIHAGIQGDKALAEAKAIRSKYMAKKKTEG